MLESTFRELSSNGAVVSVIIHLTEDGYTVGVKTITDLHVLSLYRGGTRFFKTIDAAAAVVKSCGFQSVLVSWEPVQVKPSERKLPPLATRRTPPPKKKRRK